MIEPEGQPLVTHDSVGDQALSTGDGLLADGEGNQGGSGLTSGKWSSVALALSVAAVAEFGFLLVFSKLLSGGSTSSAMGGYIQAMILVPFILGGLIIWHVGLGMVMGAIFRTMPVLLRVWAGVLVGAGLDSLVRTSEANVDTVVIISLCVLLFVLPGYRVGARRASGRPRT
jgi:hypothetical protein